MSAYYNEIDKTAAHVLRELIKRDVIAPGDVDERSIKEVQPDDIKSYTQCHFFAGGGLWSVAARLAGWPDDKPLWTGSCPCQPFSQAGQGRGVADERHLWPDFHRLIAAGRPTVVVGEQVAGKAGYGWLDGVRADLGAEGYASGAVDIPAASVDAPHIRQRLYWVAVENTNFEQQGRWGHPHAQADRNDVGARPIHQAARSDGAANRESIYADTHRDGSHSTGAPSSIADSHQSDERVSLRSGLSGVTQGDAIDTRLERHARHGGAEAGRAQPNRSVAASDGGDVGNPASQSCERNPGSLPGAQAEISGEGQHYGDRADRLRLANGSFWSDHEWLTCHDGKARRTKPGLRLLVNGYAGRVGAWRIGGNAIVAPLAAEVLKALLETA